MVGLWLSAGAYHHCFLIAPLVVWLVWSNRDGVAGVHPRPTLVAGLALALCGGAWLVADRAGIAEAAQFALVGMLEAAILMIVGGRICRRLAIPLLLLWMMVPSGESLVPHLQQSTAWGAVALLDLINVPVFAAGLEIDTPQGHYVVAPGCAGLNFLLAALVLGLGFAELMYRDPGRRALFVLAMVAAAVVGNIVRVFLLILVAESLGSPQDLLDDHLLYGWAFYLVILVGGMALGRRFRQDLSPWPAPVASRSVAPAPVRSRTVALTAAVLAAVPPLVSLTLPVAPAVAPAAVSLSCGDGLADDRRLLLVVPPTLAGASVRCDLADHRLEAVLVQRTLPLRQGKLIRLDRQLIDSADWVPLTRARRPVRIGAETAPASVVVYGAGERRALVWSLVWVDGAWREPGWEAAWADFRADLAGRRRAALLLVATDGDGPDGTARLERFLDVLAPAGLVGAVIQ